MNGRALRAGRRCAAVLIAALAGCWAEADAQDAGSWPALPAGFVGGPGAGLVAASAGLQYFIALDSDPGDLILNGGSRRLDSSRYDIYAVPITDLLATPDSGVYVFLYDPVAAAVVWTFNFEAPAGETLRPGTYGPAQRYPFQAPPLPGLSATGENKGCNVSTGWFKVLELDYDFYGNVSKLSLDFVQHCQNAAAAMYGGIRLGSLLPYPRAVPDASAGDFQVADQGGTVTLDGSLSSDHYHGGLTAYQWSQIAGTPVALASPAAAATSFVAPAVAAGGATLGFSLKVTDAQGGTDSASVKVLVHNPADRRYRALLDSGPGEAIGQGRGMLSFDEANSWIDTTRLGSGDIPTGLEFGIGGTPPDDSRWIVDFEGPGGKPLAPGKYEGAVQSTTRGAVQPRLSASSTYLCNGGGNFKVIEYTVDALGYPTRAAIDFDYYCPEDTHRPLSGALRYASAVPVVQPGPVAYAGPARTVAPRAGVTLGGGRSHDQLDMVAAPLTYAWTEISGPPVVLGGATGPQASFTAPGVAAGKSVVLRFRLTVTDGQGLSDSDIIAVTVRG